MCQFRAWELKIEVLCLQQVVLMEVHTLSYLSAAAAGICSVQFELTMLAILQLSSLRLVATSLASGCWKHSHVDARKMDLEHVHGCDCRRRHHGADPGCRASLGRDGGIRHAARRQDIYHRGVDSSIYALRASF